MSQLLSNHIHPAYYTPTDPRIIGRTHRWLDRPTEHGQIPTIIHPTIQSHNRPNKQITYKAGKQTHKQTTTNKCNKQATFKNKILKNIILQTKYEQLIKKTTITIKQSKTNDNSNRLRFAHQGSICWFSLSEYQDWRLIVDTIFLFSFLIKNQNDKKKSTNTDNDIPTRAVKSNVRQSPKPASWKCDQVEKTSAVKAKPVPLKPTPRGKPIQKQKKVL